MVWTVDGKGPRSWGTAVEGPCVGYGGQTTGVGPGDATPRTRVEPFLWWHDHPPTNLLPVYPVLRVEIVSLSEPSTSAAVPGGYPERLVHEWGSCPWGAWGSGGVGRCHSRPRLPESFRPRHQASGNNWRPDPTLLLGVGPPDPEIRLGWDPRGDRRSHETPNTGSSPVRSTGPPVVPGTVRLPSPLVPSSTPLVPVPVPLVPSQPPVVPVPRPSGPVPTPPWSRPPGPISSTLGGSSTTRTPEDPVPRPPGIRPGRKQRGVTLSESRTRPRIDVTTRVLLCLIRSFLTYPRPPVPSNT